MSARLLVVGCGGWGARLAAKLETLAGCVLVGTVDPALDEWAFGVEHFQDLPRALHRVCPSHVVVATPPSERVRVVRVIGAMDTVRSVRIEKPVALTHAEGLALQEALAWNGIKGVAGHTPLASGCADFLRAQGDKRGGVRMVWCERVANRLPNHPVDVWADLGVHDLATVRTIVGGKIDAGLESDTTAGVYQAGRRVGQVTAAYDLAQTPRRLTVVEYGDGSALTLREQTQAVSDDAGNVVFQGHTDPLLRELHSWVTGGDEGVTSLADGVGVVAAGESLWNRESVGVAS